MLLLSFDENVPESALRELCDSTWIGTDAVQAIEAARQLGLPTAKNTRLT